MIPDKPVLSAALHHAYPMERIMSDYVTRIELADAMRLVETKICNSELRQRNWVLGGCLAIILAGGGGYMSLVAKIDRLTEVMPIISSTLDERRTWMLRKDQQDAQQDRAIKDVIPSYQTSPYVEPPK